MFKEHYSVCLASNFIEKYGALSTNKKNWFRLFHRNLWSTRNKSNETNSFFCLNDSIFLRIRFYFSKMFWTKSHPFIIKFRLLTSYQLLLTFGDFKNVVFSSWTPVSHASSPSVFEKKSTMLKQIIFHCGQHVRVSSGQKGVRVLIYFYLSWNSFWFH